VNSNSIDDFQFFPNPVNEEKFVASAANGLKNITIYDMSEN
jgi:hypothetical protein